MKKVGVIFGGVACEHDVSIITGLQLIENIDKSKYEVIPIYIHLDGEWYVGKELLNQAIYKDFDSKKNALKKGVILPNKPELMMEGTGLFGKPTYIKLDVVIPAMHGMNGEDGTLQGLLELSGIPYTSSGVLGASTGMDKIIMKKIFEANDIPVLPYTYFLRGEWEKDEEAVIANIESALAYPMFVKPSNLGSSIGISKAKDRESLMNAIEIAIHYDERIIVEHGVEHLTEVNCSALGRADNIKVSVCEQPVNWAEFLTFEDKYLHGGKSSKLQGSKLGAKGGMSTMTRKVPADISESQTKQVKEYTKQAFKALNAKGVSRVDFIVDNDDGKVYVNEINTIPGSFAFYLWNYQNEMSYRELIDELIKIAEEEHAEKMKNTFTYQSAIMDNQTITGIKAGKLGE
ncbi:MAG: D-alanine--D-alanine ligase [Clostridia bacterium]|nr:D-alanine--D-alanine ligase [Clostridia bacterium]